MTVNQHIYALRIQIEDTDYLGMAYHANYLRYMERARSEWFDSLGMGMSWQQEHGIGFVVHSAHLNFISPARLADKVEVVSEVRQMKPASIVFAQHLRLAGDNPRILFRAEIKIACVNAALEPVAYQRMPVLETIRRTLT